MTAETSQGAEIYEPGVRRCPKCKCVVISQTMHTQSGAVIANDKPDACPNGCGPMWRVLKSEWRQE